MCIYKLCGSLEEEEDFNDEPSSNDVEDIYKGATSFSEIPSASTSTISKPSMSFSITQASGILKNDGGTKSKKKKSVAHADLDKEKFVRFGE